MKREFSFAAAWTAASTWIEQAAAALVFLVIARLIGVESFGIASMAFAFLFLGEFLVRDTITEAIIEREELEEGRLEATFLVLSALGLAVTLVLVAAAPGIAWLFDEPSVALLLALASPTVFLVALGGVSTALLRRRMEYKTLAIRVIVGVVLGGVTGIVMALNGFGAWSLVGQRVVEIGVNTTLALIAARWWPKRLPGRDEIGLVRGLGPRVLKLRVFTLIVQQTPTVMLGIFADPRATGLYAFSARLVEIVLKLSVRVIQGVAQSAIAALRRRSGATSGFFLDLSELAALAGFVSLAGLAVIARPLTRVMLGPDWDAAADVLPMLCAAGAVLTLRSVQEAYLMANDRLGAYLRAVMLEAALGVVLVGLAAPFGPVAVGAAVALTALLVLPLCTRAALAPETIPAGDFTARLRAPAVVAALMVVVLAIWRVVALGAMPDVVYLALTVALGAGLALGTVVLFMPATLARLKSYLTE